MSSMSGIGTDHIEADRLHAGALLTAGQRARWTLGEMVGRSAAMERLFLQMRYLAKHLRVGLVEGEAGTGKRLVAETLGQLASDRAAASLAHPSAAGVSPSPMAPPSSSASAIAVEDASAFLAHCHTQAELNAWLASRSCHLFYLQNVDRLQAPEQQALLQLCGWMLDRGGARKASVSEPAGHIALLLGSQSDLRKMVAQQLFRSDLYQKLATIRLELPPLRDRAEDIPLLVERFLSQARCTRDRQSTRDRQAVQQEGASISQQALLALQASSWPGNVAALRSAIEQADSLAQGGRLDCQHFADLPQTGGQAPLSQPGPPSFAAPGQSGATATLLRWPPAHSPAQKDPAALSPHSSSVRQQPAPNPLQSGPVGSVSRTHPSDNAEPDTLTTDSRPLLAEDANLDRAILRHIGLVLHQCKGNKLRASRLLGISRSTLYRLIEADARAIDGRRGAAAR